MKIKKGKIVKCDISELYKHWLNSGLCDHLSFDSYLYRVKASGVKVKGVLK